MSTPTAPAHNPQRPTTTNDVADSTSRLEYSGERVRPAVTKRSRESVWMESRLVPQVLKSTPQHPLKVIYQPHTGRKSHTHTPSLDITLGELVEDLNQLSHRPALDWPLNPLQPEELWTIACIDVDAEQPELLHPTIAHHEVEQPAFHQVSLSGASTPPRQHLVWLVVNVPSPTLITTSGHTLAEYELDAEAVKEKEHALRFVHGTKQNKKHITYPRVQVPVEKQVSAGPRKHALLKEGINTEIVIKPWHELTDEEKEKYNELHDRTTHVQLRQKEAIEELKAEGELTAEQAEAREEVELKAAGAYDPPEEVEGAMERPIREKNEWIGPNEVSPSEGEAESFKIEHDVEGEEEPPVSRGPHRYIFLVYGQRSPLPTNKLLEGSFDSRDKRSSFSLSHFIHEHSQIRSSEGAWAGTFCFVGSEPDELLIEQQRLKALMKPIEEQVRLPAGGAKHPPPKSKLAPSGQTAESGHPPSSTTTTPEK